MKSLTWNDLARIYHERTGGQARIQPMEKIFNWALNQSDIQENEDGSLYIQSPVKNIKGNL